MENKELLKFACLLLWLAYSSATVYPTIFKNHRDWHYFGNCDKGAEKFDICGKDENEGRGFCYKPGKSGKSSKGQLKCVRGLPCLELPSDVAHGFFKLTNATDRRLGATAVLQCCEGYETDGEVNITCGVFRNWTMPDEDEGCKPVECDDDTLPDVDDGEFVVQGDGDFMDVAELKCDDGYKPVNHSSASVCQADKTWSSSGAACEKVDCGNPPSIAYGSYVASGTTEFMDTANISCDSGYEASDDTGSVECLANETWSEPSETCEPVDCGTPTNPADGSYDLVDGTTYQSSAVLKCDPGFEPSSTAAADIVSVCLADKSWSVLTTTCDPIS